MFDLSVVQLTTDAMPSTTLCRLLPYRADPVMGSAEGGVTSA